MGAGKHIFDNKDVNKRIEAQIYVTGPLKALLRGFTPFSHKKNPGIRWGQVREKHIKNREVRGLLYNMPNIDAYVL